MYDTQMIMDPDIAKSLAKSDVELEKTTMEDLRKQMPKLIQLVYPERRAPNPRGRGKHIYEKPQIWPEHIPFHDPNNRRNGIRPTKQDVLAMFEHLIKLYKEGVDESVGDNIMEAVNAAQPGGMSQKVMYEESGESDELKYEPYLTQPRPEYNHDISIQPKAKPTSELGPKLEEIDVGNTDNMIDLLKRTASSLPMLIEDWKTKICKIEEFVGTDLVIHADDLSVLAKQAIQLKELTVRVDTTLEKVHTHYLTHEKDLLSVATKLHGLNQQNSSNYHSMEVDDQLVADTITTQPVMVLEAPKLEYCMDDVNEQKKNMNDDINLEMPHEKFHLEYVDSGTANQLYQTIDEITQLKTAMGDVGYVSRQNKDFDFSTSTIDETQLETMGITTRPRKEHPHESSTQKIQQVKAANPQFAPNFKIIEPPSQTTATMIAEKHLQVFQPATQTAKTEYSLDLDELEKMFAPTEDSSSPILFNNTLSIPSKQLLPAPRNMVTQERSQMVTSYCGRGKRGRVDTEATCKVPKLANEDVHGYTELRPNIPTFIQEEQAC